MHFLRKDEAYRSRRAEDLIFPWGRGRACVTVKLINATTLEVQANGVGVLRKDAMLVPLPERMTVAGSDKRVITAGKGMRLHVSTESFNPMHIIAEIPV